MWPRTSGRSEPASQRSLALRLTAVFGLLGYGLVGILGLFLDSTMNAAIRAQVDREVRRDGQVLLHRLDEDNEPVSKELLDLGPHMFLRLLDREGRVLLESKGMAAQVPGSGFGGDGEAWSWSSERRPGAGPHRLHALDWKGGRIQLARDFTDEAWVLGRLRTTLVWVFLVAPGLAAILGYRLVKLGLSPLGHLVVTLEDLRPDTLQSRVDAAAVPAELAPLAEALNRAVARLEEAFGRLTELNADLAHELRTPLHSLRLEVEDLLGRKDLPEPAPERLGGMMESLDHLNAVIEQMLTLSRLEDPSGHLGKERLEAGALLASAATPFESLAEEAGVRLEWEVEAGLSLEGDRVLLRRALHNLLANALRHAPAGSVVHLRAWTSAEGPVLGVEDQGPGMAPELVAQIGRRFLRQDASRSQRTGGSGLGLAIVRRIAELHGGALEIRSREGLGTEARLRLPAG